MDDSLDISNSRSKSFDGPISNKLEKFDEEITKKHLLWPHSFVSKPNKLDKISIEDSRESLIKSSLSRIKYNVKKLDDLSHKHFYWSLLSVSKTNELDKISIEDSRESLSKSCSSRCRTKLHRIKYYLEKLCDLEKRYLSASKPLSNELDKKSLEDSRESLIKSHLSNIPHILNRIDKELEKLNDLEENYLSASKQISNKLNKKSLEDSRESLLISCLSQFRHILYAIKNDLEILDDLNIGAGEDQIHEKRRFHKRRLEVSHKSKSENQSRKNHFQVIFEPLSIDKQSLIEKPLSIDKKLLNDEQIHNYLKNNYKLLINSKNKKWPPKHLFEQIEKYLNSIDKNDELKQRLLDNKSINKEEKQFLNCVMTSLSILCELSDNCEDYATNIHNYTQIINPLLNLLERFSHNQYSHSIADQLLENIVFIFTNLSRRLNNLPKANWIIYLEQCLNNKKLRELIHISAALAIAFQCDEDFQDSLNVRLLINKGYERANANKNKEWSGFSLEEFREGLDKLKL